VNQRRFDAWTRRRLGLAATGIAGLMMICGDADARKKRKRKRKPPPPPPPPPSACAQACGTACTFCFHRAAGSLVCGEGSSVACGEACTADDDCLDPSRRYCLLRSEDRATGAVTDLCFTPGGHCGHVNACEA
jgi:hypothetical protein